MNITIGETLPEFEIVKGGRATEAGKFEAWGSDELEGKATLVLLNSGFPEANDMHHEWSTKVAEKGVIRFCRIIDSKDAPMGAGMFIKGEFKKGAKAAPNDIFVMDGKSVAGKTLGMDKKSAIVAIVDAENKVLFANHGTMTTEAQAAADAVIADLK